MCQATDTLGEGLPEKLSHASDRRHHQEKNFRNEEPVTSVTVRFGASTVVEPLEMRKDLRPTRCLVCLDWQLLDTQESLNDDIHPRNHQP